METTTNTAQQLHDIAEKLLHKAIVEVNLPEGDWICGYVIAGVQENEAKDTLYLMGEETGYVFSVKRQEAECLLSGGSVINNRCSELHLMDADKFLKEEKRINYLWLELRESFEGKVMRITKAVDGRNGETLEHHETIIKYTKFWPEVDPGYFPEKLELHSKEGILGTFNYYEAQDLLRCQQLQLDYNTWVRLLPLDTKKVCDALVGMRLLFEADPPCWYTVEACNAQEKDGEVTIQLYNGKCIHPVDCVSYSKAVELTVKDIDDDEEK